MTPEQRSMAARVASYTRWAMCDDRTNATAPARRGFDDRWTKQVDPDGTLPHEERVKRAEALRKAHFVRMALLSSQARARKRRTS
ncbi:hypothetical protein [Amycolatopsis sp. MEPSY49]|uniref:hypothetical protein n=1 Tax=Amycolatopsis sp. MEPSY49 TaxID=3151600 RepID=UPI003EF1763E